jgi:uncharacterized protein YbaP (TraB family)
MRTRSLPARLVLTALSLAALLLAGCKSEPRAPATTGSGSAAAAPARPPVTPYLFKADKDGKTTYLLGTMHLGVDPERLPASVYAKLDAATTLVVETDLTDPAALKIGLRSDGSTLDVELGPEYWAKFVAVVGETMAGAARHMSMMAAASLLEASMLPQTAPMDLILVGRAKNASKPIAYLESISSQVAVLGKWMDARAVKYMLDHLEHGKKAALEGLAAYEAGDDKLLDKMMDSKDWVDSGRTEAELVQFKEDLLYGRNAAWIPRLEQLHAEAGPGGVFVAVGAAHLLGPRSVIELLTQRGFTITRP